MEKIKHLVKICENDEYIYYYKKKNKILLYRAEKHKSRIWKIDSISFKDFIKNVKFSL